MFKPPVIVRRADPSLIAAEKTPQAARGSVGSIGGEAKGTGNLSLHRTFFDLTTDMSSTGQETHTWAADSSFGWSEFRFRSSSSSTSSAISTKLPRQATRDRGLESDS